jgi:hypothetical protein
MHRILAVDIAYTHSIHELHVHTMLKVYIAYDMAYT